MSAKACYRVMMMIIRRIEKTDFKCFNFVEKKISVYVKSNTVVGDKNYPTGVVLAEIIKANIPVKNGVVHLIQRPLIVVDTTIKEFLEVSEQAYYH